ncbi:hypothetical protein BCU70_13615 [Vibrio sp. 10N.286.49.C2]|uniref:BatD family protein n=1 Tax=unclassified Vibrio TaxID=2614977 RepID=UPI000C84003E|nr:MULTISPECIES: BatD family protein [unclassified Vibrio]PMH38838.1 hypothetical protein BCU70_13615 [Vibrio sp. 10N.286.49.C2]PMH55314.1 hypothetical protein BCU66_09385 [Vibrio sp. 10N.286.49.B1]PMH83791.1 hypothetical protein BCU58_13460 [Vibrio sp. 10N.286.48.B7]
MSYRTDGMSFLRGYWLLFLLLIALLSCSANGNDLAQNQAESRVAIRAWVEPKNLIAVHQQVIVNIEVMTDTWFTKGTLIHRFEVANALVVSNQKFAYNSTQILGGKTYVKQRWEVAVYPLKTGDVFIPSITAELTIKSEGGDLTGYLATQPFHFKVNKPSVMMVDDVAWLVSPDVRFQQDWLVTRATRESQSEQVFEVGDAIQRTISLRASDASIMLMPDLNHLENADNESYFFYPGPVIRSDDSNRGEYWANQSQQLTYRFKAPGEFSLPDMTIYQWNPKTQLLTPHTLSGKRLTVEHTLLSFIKAYFPQIILFVFTFLVLFVLGRRVIYRYQNAKKEGLLPLWWQYGRAIKLRQDVMAENVLYRRQLDESQQYCLVESTSSALKKQILLRLQRQRYGKKQSQSARLKRRDWFNLW